MSELTYLGERCKSDRCQGHRVGVGFSAPDEVWEAVGSDKNVLCFPCFDRMAQEKGVAYDIRDLEFWPVSWEMMQSENYEAYMTAYASLLHTEDDDAKEDLADAMDYLWQNLTPQEMDQARKHMVYLKSKK